MHKHIVLVLLFGILLTFFMEEMGYCESTILPDSSNLEIRLPNDSYFDLLREDDAFDYGAEYKAAKPTGPLARLIRFLGNLWENARNVFVIIPFLFKLLIFALIVFFIILLITRTKLNRVFFSQKNLAPLPFEVDDLDEDIADFDAAIANMVEQKLFRSAIRLLYLKTIDRLRQFNIIEYSREKTNRDYLYEITDSLMKEGFLAITDVYNRVWYGQFPVDDEAFEVHKTRFNQFLKDNQLV